MSWVADKADERQVAVAEALREAFRDYIEVQPLEVVLLEGIAALQLAEIIQASPLIVKALLTICNVAGRAVERDIGIKGLDTYRPRLTKEQAVALGAYLKPFLPPRIALAALSQLDRTAFIDKEIRASKGRWEQEVRGALNRAGKKKFKKRKFKVGGQSFELDAATPETGDIHIGIDVKRIEARKDIHKRCDEIVNKAQKFKKAHPNGRFGVVIYYPFVDEQINVQNRLESDEIDGIVFASSDREVIESAARLLLDQVD